MDVASLKALGIEDDAVISKILKAAEGDLSGYVEKSKFDAISANLEGLQAQLADRDKQIEGLKKAGNPDELKAQIEKLQADNKEAQDKFTAEMKSMKVNAAIETALTKAKAKNLTAVKALLKADELDSNADDADKLAKALTSQIEALQKDKDTSFLFDADTTAAAATASAAVVKGGAAADPSSTGGDNGSATDGSFGAQMAKQVASDFGVSGNAAAPASLPGAVDGNSK